MNKGLISLIALFLTACSTDYTPKPSGFFRIDLPEKSYQSSTLHCPFSFEYAQYATIEERTEDCWFDLNHPDFSAKLHMSYLLVEQQLNTHLENARELAYKHSKVAEAISEQPYQNKGKKVYGMVYSYEGNTATAMQFYLTDSSQHFVRGALYFNTQQTDSLAPVSDFLEEDIYHLIDSWEWK